MLLACHAFTSLALSSASIEEEITVPLGAQIVPGVSGVAVAGVATLTVCYEYDPAQTVSTTMRLWLLSAGQTVPEDDTQPWAVLFGRPVYVGVVGG